MIPKQIILSINGKCRKKQCETAIQRVIILGTTGRNCDFSTVKKLNLFANYCLLAQKAYPTFKKNVLLLPIIQQSKP
jgi:hypothetical protein